MMFNKAVLLLPALWLTVLVYGGEKKPPGTAISTRLAFTIPSPVLVQLLKAPRPDSSVFIMRRPVQKPSRPDSSSFRDMLGFKIDSLKPHSPLGDYKAVTDFLVSNNNFTCYRLFFRNGEGVVIRYLDYHPDGTLLREVMLADPLNRLVEVTSFYKNDIVLSKSRQQYTEPVLARNTDSLWYGLKPVLKLSGHHRIFYPDGTLKSLRVYEDGKLVRTEKDTVLKNDLLGNKLNYGQRKAFLIGIDTYGLPPAGNIVKPEAGYFNLGGCINDVEALRSGLVGGQEFRQENIRVLINDQATRAGILSGLQQFTASLKKGDFVFIHFSGHGGEESGTYKLVCRDWYKPAAPGQSGGYLYQEDLEKVFTQIKKGIGRDGQLIFSMDASTGGSSINRDDKAETEEASFRGETQTLMFNSTRNEAPFTFITSASPNELSYETRYNGKIMGAYSYALSRVLLEKSANNISDLCREVNRLIGERDYRQTSQYYSNFNQLLFESTLFTAPVAETVLPDVKLRGNVFVLSAGISQYKSSNPGSGLRFSNCVSDATGYAAFFQAQAAAIGGSQTLRSFLLTDSTATKEAILKAINETISASRPEDYFIFNFSGYCRPLSDSTGKKVTYFVPYGLKNIADTFEIKKEGIPLSQLKDLLQLLPANNQLFITEAGSTSDFQKEFIQALMETSPTIAALSNKNRIFIVPRSSGLDKFFCNSVPVEHGPLHYYITGLENGLNLFGLFENELYAGAVKYALQGKEISCDFFKSGYFDIFFEREYIKDLQYFLPEEIMKSRGVIGTNQAREALAAGNSKRYALVMGTNRYAGKPDWEDLFNAAPDAEAVAKELKDGFGYEVKLLIDKPIDSFFAHIAYLSGKLKVNDQLVIYVAGHGDFDSVLLDDGFIVCSNSRPVKEDPYRNSYIQYSKLEKMVNKLPANQVLMMLDVCFGGTFDERVAQNKGRTRVTDYDEIADKTFFAKKLEIKTRLYLTSGGKRTVPDGYRGKHSPFALKLLEALRARGGSSKMITARDLHKFVQKLPSGPLLGSFGDDGLDSEFILLGNQ